MTTITIDAHLDIPQTHFRDMDEFAAYIAQWNFEKQLDEWVSRSKNKKVSEFINI